jgi:chromate reductase, NAD(P)H dehydrogenase (quinone)
MKIGILVGSLRRDSYNRKVAMTLMQLAGQSLEMEILEIGNLPLFNQDLEDKPPEEWVQFRNKLRNLTGFLLVTPEYNRSIPAALKNALDVGSRPYGKNLWDKLPCAVISVSIGAMGGFGANHHLRQSFVFLNSPCMQQPEVYLSYADKLFNEKGEMTQEGTKKFLGQFLLAFEKWVHVNRR